MDNLSNKIFCFIFYIVLGLTPTKLKFCKKPQVKEHINLDYKSPEEKYGTSNKALEIFSIYTKTDLF